MGPRWTLKLGRKANPGKRNAVEIATPVFGYKNHLTTDVPHGFFGHGP